MNIVLLQGQLTVQEIDILLKEFPQYFFLSLSETAYKNMSADHWARLEILYGTRINPEELSMAHQLRWIHCPTNHLNRICMDEIEKQGNLLVTSTKDENNFQVGEFVMAGMLAFAKNLFAWKTAGLTPGSIWDSKLRESMWTLQNRVHLQIGLGGMGMEITKRARELNMRVWGMQPKPSFHRYCHKTFALKELHAILPFVDVVCITLARGKEYHHLLQQEELDLMKEDSILIVIGSTHLINQEALVRVAESGKFRGIILDALYQVPIPPTSPLWSLPNILITPEIAPRPKSTERQAFKTFLYNLRQYLHGNFKDMRNVVDKTAGFLV